MFPKIKMLMIIEFFEFICIAKDHRSVFGCFCRTIFIYWIGNKVVRGS